MIRTRYQVLYDMFRASIGEERMNIINRIDSNRLFFLMNRLFFVEKYGFGFVPSGNHVLFSNFSYEIRKKHLTEHTADKYRGEQMRATAYIVACSPPTASIFFLAAQARKLSLSASLEWAEEPLKRHVRDSDGDEAIEVLRFSSVFWVNRMVLVALGRSS